MSIDIYNDAFKSLSILNENLFDTSTLGVTKLHSFIDDDFEEDDISIIDPEASTDEELSDSYVGKIIVDCNVCHSHIFKNREDLDIDESGLVNGEDVCPYCGEQEGFVIIGQIEEFKEGEDPEEAPEEEDNSEMPEEEIPTPDTPEEDTDEEDEEKNESLKSLTKNQPLTEELNEAAGDDLASRVLAYLDRLEAGGELTESMNNVRVETDENTVTVNSDENGKVTVTTEPNESPVESGEMIAPIPEEEQSAIIDSELSADVDAPVEGEEIDLGSAEDFSDDEIDFDMEEIDEESIDNLGESYLKRVYENVDSFKTTNSYIRENKIILEGVISFTSGKKSKTGFILESKSADKTGKVSFTGYNKHFTDNKNAYLFEGKIKDKRLVLEKMSYRYSLNENMIRGRVYNK